MMEEEPNQFRFDIKPVKFGPFLPFDLPNAYPPLHIYKYDYFGKWRPRYLPLLASRYKGHDLATRKMFPKFLHVNFNLVRQSIDRHATYVDVRSLSNVQYNPPENWHTLTEYVDRTDEDDKTYFQCMQFDFNGSYHPDINRLYWGSLPIFPYLSNNFRQQRDRQRGLYKEFSIGHLGYKNTMFEIIYDSKLCHPTSKFYCSAWRIDRDLTCLQRKRYYSKHWDKIFPVMVHLLDFAMIQQHDLIVVEPTCLANNLSGRANFAYELQEALITFCGITILTASHRSRWPSLFMFPCILCIYCDFIFTWELANDPAFDYSCWASFVNKPTLMNCLDDINVPPYLTREEKICVLQREVWNPYMIPWNNLFRQIAVFSAYIAIKMRIKYGTTVSDMTWEVFKRKICYQSVDGIFHSLGPFLTPSELTPKFMYKPFLGMAQKSLFVIGISGFYYFFLRSFFNRVKALFHEQTRLRLILNRFTHRALFGERRYQRLMLPYYWSYRAKYPRDSVGVLDDYYLSQESHEAYGSIQFLY